MKFFVGLTVCFAFLMLTVGNVSADIVRVPGAQQRSIQDGIDDAGNGDTVLVSPGEYDRFQNDWAVVVDHPVTIMSSSGPEATTITCSGQANFIFSIESDDVVITGFTFEGATNSAITTDESGISDLEISYCIFQYNSLSAAGGDVMIGAAISLVDVDAYIHHCRFENNLAGVNEQDTGLSGGAIGISTNSQVDIHSCFFIENKSFRFGGAIYLTTSGTEVNIINCIFIGNETEAVDDAAADGGAIAATGSATANIMFCNILDNVAGVETDDDWGGGIYMGSSTRGDIINNILWGNEGNSGTQIALQNTGNPDVDYNLVMDYDDGGNQGWTADNILTDEPEFEGGREPDWGIDGYFLPEDFPAIDFGSDESSEFGMDSMTTHIDFIPDEDAVDIGYHYYFWDFTIIGNINGEVFKYADSTTISYPEVTLHFGNITYEHTGFIDGYYRFRDVPALPYWIEVHADGFIDSAKYDLVLAEGETDTINWYLLNPELSVSRDTFEEEIENDENIVYDYTVKNTGNGLLEFEVEARPPPEAFVYPWTLHHSVELPDTVLDDQRLTGAIYVDSLFFVAGRNSTNSDSLTLIYVVDGDGELQYRFPQPGIQYSRRAYMESLTYDGELLWGVKDEVIWGMDKEGNVQDTIILAADYRNSNKIAWDSNREVFWISSLNGPLVSISRDGDVGDVIELDGTSYALGVFPDDRDGFDVYYTNQSNGRIYIHKVNPETGEEVDVVDYGLGSYWAGPGGITSQFDPQNWVFVMLMGGSDGASDRVDVVQVSGNTSWMRLAPREGQILPADSIEATLTLKAIGLAPRTYEGEIVYLHNAAGLETHYPVTMRVTLDAPSIDREPLPNQFDIVNVYPNPFNAQTTVVYNLPVAGLVQFRVFDILGRELIEHTSSVFVQAGLHEFSLNGNDLPSGMYLVELATAEQRKLAKVLLMK